MSGKKEKQMYDEYPKCLRFLLTLEDEVREELRKEAEGEEATNE